MKMWVNILPPGISRRGYYQSLSGLVSLLGIVLLSTVNFMMVVSETTAKAYENKNH